MTPVLASRRRPGQRRVVAGVYVAILFVMIMDATIVNVALPSLARSFGVPATSVNGVIVGYLVALGVFMPVSGWLGDRIGIKRLFLSAMGLFTVASAACAEARSLPMLVAVRCCQGAGSGLLTPVGLTMLFRVVAEPERVRVARILMVPTAIAPATAPVLGGLLVEGLSWRWVFWVNVPICLVTFVVGLHLLHPGDEHLPGSFDRTGFLLSGAGTALAMYALSEGSSIGWASAPIVVSGLLGAVMLAALVAVTRRARAPILDLCLLAQPRLRAALGVMAAASASFSAVLYIAPLLLQDGRGYSPLQSGLTTFPEALGVACGTQLFGRLFERFAARYVIGAGLGLAATAIGLLACVGPRGDRGLIMAMMFLTGVGMAGEMVPAQMVAFEGIQPAVTSAVSTLYNVGGRLTSALGVSLAGAIIVAAAPPPDAAHATLTGYRWAFVAAAAAALAGAAIASRLPPRAAEPQARSGELDLNASTTAA